MPLRRGECEQLPLFRALPGDDMALRDAQDLMAYPFFSLGKSRRTVPIRFEAGAVALTVEGVPEHGIATIWDADVLIWAASQIIQARREGIAPSRLMAAAPHEILRFVQRVFEIEPRIAHSGQDVVAGSVNDAANGDDPIGRKALAQDTNDVSM